MSDVCPGCGVDSITPHIAGCSTVADRPLFAGSERLGKAVYYTGIPMGEDGMGDDEAGEQAYSDAIKADPGIVALVSYVIDDDCVCKDLKRLAEMAGRPPSPELCGRCATIKLWETGE